MERKIDCYWDTSGDKDGWFCEVTENGEYKDDSMKIWFPINVDIYAQEDGEMLRRALEINFPRHKIVIR